MIHYERLCNVFFQTKTGTKQLRTVKKPKSKTSHIIQSFNGISSSISRDLHLKRNAHLITLKTYLNLISFEAPLATKVQPVGIVLKTIKVSSSHISGFIQYYYYSSQSIKDLLSIVGPVAYNESQRNRSAGRRLKL